MGLRDTSQIRPAPNRAARQAGGISHEAQKKGLAGADGGGRLGIREKSESKVELCPRPGQKAWGPERGKRGLAESAQGFKVGTEADHRTMWGGGLGLPLPSVILMPTPQTSVWCIEVGW